MNLNKWRSYLYDLENKHAEYNPKLSLINESIFESSVYGGEVGIVLDGRGRPFNFNMNTQNRKSLIDNWRNAINEYPNLEM